MLLRHEIKYSFIPQFFPAQPNLEGVQCETRLRKFILKPCDHNIKSTFRLVDRMIELANKGDADREDVGCGILYGVLRDSAYKLKKLAEKEKRTHIQKGWWNDNHP